MASGGHEALVAALVVGSVVFCCLAGLMPAGVEHSGRFGSVLVVAGVQTWHPGDLVRLVFRQLAGAV